MTRTRRPNHAVKGVIRKNKAVATPKVSVKAVAPVKTKKAVAAKPLTKKQELAAEKKSINTRLLEILRSRQASDAHLEKRIRMKRKSRKTKEGDGEPEQKFDEYGYASTEKSFENLSHDTGLTFDSSPDEVEQFYERGDNFDEELNFD